MLLLIDAGNTRVKWLMQDEFGVTLATGAGLHDEWLNEVVERLARLSLVAIVASCVSGQDVKEQIKKLGEQFGVIVHFVAVVQKACGLTNGYQALDRLGVDRWVAAVGTMGEFGDRCRVVVDAGTAVTIDIVDERNCFLGGVILPGADLMHDMLIGNTAGICSRRQDVGSVIGKTTSQCVNAGAEFGLAGAVERIVDEMAVCLGQELELLFCGGDAEWLSGRVQKSSRVVEGLLFDGLSLLYRDNSKMA